MMENSLRDLLYALPTGIDYTEDLCALDEQDIPVERIPKLLELLKGDDSEAAFRAALVLCSWGNEDGFEYMRTFALRVSPESDGWYPHRLRGYDDTCYFVILAFRKYWARESDKNTAAGLHARERLFQPMAHIIELSNILPFAIDALFYLVEEEDFTEYLPALKEHLQAIIKEPEKHHWKVADCAHLLMKFDPEFVTQTLAAHGYTLADFPNK